MCHPATEAVHALRQRPPSVTVADLSRVHRHHPAGKAATVVDQRTAGVLVDWRAKSELTCDDGAPDHHPVVVA